MASVLLVDDNPELIQEQLAHLFCEAGHEIGVARTGQDGIRQATERTPDVILLDLRLPDMTGLDVYRRLRQVDARIPVIFITDSTGADSAIEAMKQGAYDYLSKPVDLRRLRLVIGQALELSRLAREPAEVAQTPPEEDRGDSIIGHCPAMIEVYKAIGRVAGQDVTVLITGESGTGKELVARAIYQHSVRALAPFLAINCAAIPELLQESELFGHEKGAFTGADRKRIGKFEQCNGGTLFLDEVGDLPLATQAKMLRLLQEQTFERVGGNETVHTDVRLIAATNHDLESLASEGKYRLDLIYRLSGFTIQLPPLRERGDDQPLLVQHYMRRFNRQLGRELREISPAAMRKLRQYSWPGNIRELQSVLKQAMLQSTGPVLVPEFLPEFGSPKSVAAAEVEPRLEAWIEQRLQAGGGDLYQEVHQHVDRHLLAQVLRLTEGNQVQAVRILGIAPRTLRLKLRELGLSITKSVEEDKDESV